MFRVSECCYCALIKLSFCLKQAPITVPLQVIFAIDTLLCPALPGPPLTSFKLIFFGNSTFGSLAFLLAYFSYKKASESFGVSFGLILNRKSSLKWSTTFQKG